VKVIQLAGLPGGGARRQLVASAFQYTAPSVSAAMRRVILDLLCVLMVYGIIVAPLIVTVSYVAWRHGK
jgi:hypothetical protein